MNNYWLQRLVKALLTAAFSVLAAFLTQLLFKTMGA